MSTEFITVAGYGSLLSEASARETAPGLRNFHLCRIHGYRRIFNKVAMVFFERHGATQDRLDLAAVSTEPAPGQSFIGCRFEVPEAEFLAIFEREHRYRWVMVDTGPVEGEGDTVRARMTTGMTDEEYRLNKVPSAEEYHRRVGRFYSGRLWRDDILPFPTYLRHILRAIRSASEEAYEDFLDTSYLADGTTTIRQYIARNPDWERRAGDTYSYLER